MAFVTLRFHYTIFCRQIQHIFEIFGTLRYKSTRSIRHKSHKPTFMKTFYRQSYENFCQTEYFPEICGFMQCRRTARFGTAKTRKAAASRCFAAVRCADCGACAVAGLHYPRRFVGEALSQRPRRFAVFGVLASNQKPRARRRGATLTRRAHYCKQCFFGALRGFLNPRFLPHLDKRRKLREALIKSGMQIAQTDFSCKITENMQARCMPRFIRRFPRQCRFVPQAHGAFWLRGLRRVRRGGAALSPPICGRSTIPTAAAFCCVRDIGKEPKAACPPTRGCPHEAGTLPQAMLFSAHFAAFSIPDSSPTPTNAANRGKC